MSVLDGEKHRWYRIPKFWLIPLRTTKPYRNRLIWPILPKIQRIFPGSRSGRSGLGWTRGGEKLLLVISSLVTLEQVYLIGNTTATPKSPFTQISSAHPVLTSNFSKNKKILPPFMQEDVSHIQKPTLHYWSRLS